MARAQVYRGDPELKQVVLFDNFSGGINTTDIDEQVAANEFRMLENVELLEQGRVAKRKGFKDIGIVQKFSEPKLDNVIYHMEVGYDKYNNFGSYNFDDFEKNKVEHDIVLISIEEYFYGVIIRAKRLYSYEERSQYKAGVEYSSLSVSPRLDYKLKRARVTGIDVHDYDGKRYFMLSQIIEGNEDLVEYYYDSKENKLKGKVYNKGNSYAPNPYELTNIGFNAYADSPHSKVSPIRIGEENYMTVLLLDAENPDIILDKLPLNGRFVARVYYTGSEELHVYTDVKFYTPVNNVEKPKNYLTSEVVFKEVREDLGYFDLDVLLQVGAHREIFIELTKSEYIDNEGEIANKFATTDAMIQHYKSEGKVIGVNKLRGYMSLELGSTTDVYGYETTKLEPVDPTTQEPIDTSNLPVLTYVNNYDGTTKGNVLDTDNQFGDLQEGFVMMKRVNYYADKPMEIVGPPFLGMFSRVPGHESGGDEVMMAQHFNIYPDEPEVYMNFNFINIDEESTGSNYVFRPKEEYMPSMSRLDAVMRTYYRYNGGKMGEVSDFDVVELKEYEIVLEYYQSWESGAMTNKPLEPIDIGKMNSIIIKDRLVLYGGNTILYSDIYSRQKDGKGDIQGFTYFPNYNWVTLSLSPNDNIQKIAYYRGSYMVFTKESIYRMSGDFNSDDFEIVIINDSIGCVAPGSVRSINNTLIFMSEDGLYVMKQNYYLDGLENVGKVDSKIRGLIPYNENYESIIHNEQYWLIGYNETRQKMMVLKQYYNMGTSRDDYPYVIDTWGSSYSVPVRARLFKGGVDLFGVISTFNNYPQFEIFKYGEGYTDFVPKYILDKGIRDYGYEVVIETPYWSFGYPLHEKKFKNVFLKVDSVRELPVYFDLFVDFGAAISSDNYQTKLNVFGEVEYFYDRKATLETLGRTELGKARLGRSALGDAIYQVHKINASTKGKTIKFRFVQGDETSFSVDAISIVYKLGKMRESR